MFHLRNLRYIVLLCLFLMAFSFASQAEEALVGNKMRPDSALQDKGVEPDNGFVFSEGDTIIISKQHTHYLTGERIARWVYYVRHIVQQVGGKRFPDGILIKGINSWVGPEEILLSAPVEREDEGANRALRERLQQDSVAIKEREQEAELLDDRTKRDINRQAELMGLEVLDKQRSDSLEAVRQEQLRQDSIRRVREKEEETRLRMIEEERLREEQRIKDSIRLAEDERARFLRAAEEADKKRVADSIRAEERKQAFYL